MHIKGRKIFKYDLVDGDDGKAIVSTSECIVCSTKPSVRVKVCYDSTEFWDDTDTVDICHDCLIVSGMFWDNDDLDRAINKL